MKFDRYIFTSIFILDFLIHETKYNLREISIRCPSGDIEPPPVERYEIDHHEDGQNNETRLPVLEDPGDRARRHQHAQRQHHDEDLTPGYVL